MSNTLKINGIFYSVQGEGRNIGKPSIFIRTTGCNFRCDFCDTKYSWKGGISMDSDGLVNKIKEYNCKHIVFTGGEPLIQKDLTKIVHELFCLLGPEYSFELESNGYIYDSQCVGRFSLINISPKFQYHCLDYIRTLKKWGNHSDFKYVICSKRDIELAKEISDICEPNHSILMLEGDSRKSQLDKLEWLINNGKEIFPEGQIIPRMHCIVYHGERGL